MLLAAAPRCACRVLLPHVAVLRALLAVVTYSADRLKPNKKKTFKGHIIAGEGVAGLCKLCHCYSQRRLLGSCRAEPVERRLYVPALH
jgi:hypothetical protein